MDINRYHARARERGVNPIVYWVTRAFWQPFAHLYLRLSRIGREHIPASGPVIFVANHRSFVDPFVVGLLTRRPVYYVAKEEIFRLHPLLAWFVGSLGAFPVRRGAGDGDMVETAKAILERGDPVLIFPEGTRTRPGALGKPKRGVGRLALETGAPVVPLAIIGTEAIRRGWRIRPKKVRVRVGSPLRFPHVETATAPLAAAVTDRIWPNVMLQWEWLGGLPPLRRAAVIGAAGTALAERLARAGIDVELAGAPPDAELPARVAPVRADLRLCRHDLVVFAVPPAELPAAVAEHAPGIAPRTGVLVLAKGLVPPLGTLPSAFVAERTRAWAVGVLGGPAEPGAALVLGAHDRAFARQVSDALAAAGLRVTHTGDVVGVELAACAAGAAARAAAAAAQAGPGAAGAAAGRVFAEVGAYAHQAGARPETLAGLAGTGDLVTSLLAGAEPPPDGIPLLAGRLREAGVDAPALRGLADVVEGRLEPARWTASLTARHARAA